jgi:hypothetical protein
MTVIVKSLAMLTWSCIVGFLSAGQDLEVLSFLFRLGTVSSVLADRHSSVGCGRLIILALVQAVEP